jgi:hypothetical protein
VGASWGLVRNVGFEEIQVPETKVTDDVRWMEREDKGEIGDESGGAGQ